MEKISISQQWHVLIGKGWKSGKPTAEPNGQKHTPFSIHKITAFRKTIQQSNNKTTCDVNHKCPKGKKAINVLLYKPRGKKTGDASQEAAGSYNY